jgi:hypothetical protein
MNRLFCLLLAGWPGLVLADAPAAAPIDSYRFMHVTIDTPWHIFLFLLVGIFAPFILMVVLVWRNSWRKWTRSETPQSGQPKTEASNRD